MGDPLELGVAGLMSHELPRLERLQVDLWMVNVMASLPTTPTLRRLDSLRSIEVPAYILHFLDAPGLKHATISIVYPADKAAVNAQLPKWTHLEDLVLDTSWMKEPTQASKAVRSILRCLTPMDESSAPVCSKLSRLGITQGSVSSEDWLNCNDTSGDDDDDVDPADNDWSKAPVIGFDLFLLASQRQHLSTQVDSDGVKKCSPLKTLRVFKYLVDPMAWGLITQAWKRGGHPDQASCHPDPTKLSRQLLQDDPGKLLPKLAEALYRANATSKLSTEASDGTVGVMA